MGPGRHFGRREGPEPDSGLLSGLTDFGDPFTPGPLSYPSVDGVFALSGPFGPVLVRTL